ncbi:MAG: sensor histidine kinase [Acidobacteriaceae bacterium]
MLQSLNSRLSLAILFAILVMGLMGGFLIRRVSDLGVVIRSVLARNVNTAATINEMRYASLEYRLSRGPSQRAEAQAHFLAALGRAQERASARIPQAMLSKTRHAWRTYLNDPRNARFSRLQTDISALQDAMGRSADNRVHRVVGSIKEFALVGTLGLAASLAVMLLFAMWMVRSIIGPMRHIARSVHELNPAGKYRDLDRYGVVEFDELTRELNGLVRRIERHERDNVERLLYENAKIDALINSIDDGLILLDRQGTILQVNFMVGMLLQADPGELLGRNINDLNVASRFYLNFRNALVSLRREEQDEPRYSRHEFSLTIRGRLHSYILKTVPFRDKQRYTMGLIVVLQDVTELRHAEHQRGQLFATLSHELKTPLTSLGLSVGTLWEIAEQEQYSPQILQLLEISKDEVGRLTALVEDLLDVSRLDATRTRMELTRFELCGFLRRQVHSFRLQAEAQEVDLTLSCVPDITINADPVKLGWVFSNLLTNALRHTPADGGIALSAERAGDHEIRIEISDTGHGIPPDQIPLVFEWYTQGSGQDKQGSAGMGLAIVREMVEAHGGSITVESTVGRGTRFVIILPNRLTDADLPGQPVVPISGKD